MSDEPAYADAVEWTHLTAFQQDLLIATLRCGGTPDADDADKPYGLAVKDELERMHRTEVNHGRLYPNFDTLAEAGYIDVGTRDKRTNTYTTTDTAVDCLTAYLRTFVGVDVDTGDVATLPARAAAASDRGDPLHQ